MAKKLIQGQKGVRTLDAKNSKIISVDIKSAPRETNSQRIFVGVVIGVLIFVITSFITGLLARAGIAVGQSIFSNEYTNTGYTEDSVNFFIYGMGVVIRWLWIPIYFVLSTIAIGIGVIFG